MKFTIVALMALLCLQVNAVPRGEEGAEKSDAALLAAAEQLIAEGDAGRSSTGEAAKQTLEKEKAFSAAPEGKGTAGLKESEIPVVMSGKKEASGQGDSIWRLVASLAIVGATAFLALFASKRWSRKKDKGGQKARIEIMHQLHLGPRKSIGLIRVAGESMLVGITDQSINMLKTVTLIDDELEHVMNKDFNGFLEDEFSIEDVRTAISGPEFRGHK